MKDTEFFEKVLETPALYIGIKSITRLKAFIDGYLIGRGEVRSREENFSLVFGDWVSKRFRIATAHSWASIILFMSGNDEPGAFDMTSELWDQYKAENLTQNS